MKKKLLFTIFVTALLAACAPARNLVPSMFGYKISGYETGGVVPTRPIWDGQILSPTELTAGAFLWEVHQNDEYLVLIMSPAYNKDGDCRYDFTYWREDWPLGRFITSGYCADAGLIAYEHGWNPNNHLMPSSRAPLSDDQLKALALFMQPAP